MPIFEYQCDECNEIFEKLVFKSEEDEIKCPKCESSNIRKKMSATSFMGTSVGTCATGSSSGFS